MRNTLVIYSSVDGHTQKISSKIAEHIKSDHVNVDLTSLVDAQSLSLKNYQQVIIGASIRYGNYRKELFEFIEQNLDELSSKENAFFSVNVVARKPEKNTSRYQSLCCKISQSNKMGTKQNRCFRRRC